MTRRLILKWLYNYNFPISEPDRPRNKRICVSRAWSFIRYL